MKTKMHKDNFTTTLVSSTHGAVLEIKYGITTVGFVSAKSDHPGYTFRTADGNFYGEANTRKEAISEILEYVRGMVR